MLTKNDLKLKYGDDIMLLFKGDEPFTEAVDGVPSGMLIERDGKVVCYECGEWHTTLSAHTKRLHKLTARDYKLKYGINLGVGLCSKAFSKSRSDAMVNRMKTEASQFSIKEVRDLGHKAIKEKATKGDIENNSMQKKNGCNLCPEQVKLRLQLLSAKFGDNFNGGQALQHDPKIVDYAQRVYGGWNKMKLQFGYAITERGKNNMKELSDLVYDLREHVNTYGKLPWKTKWNGLTKKKKEITLHGFPHCRRAYQDRFGSLLKAYAKCGVKKNGKRGVYKTIS